MYGVDGLRLACRKVPCGLACVLHLVFDDARDEDSTRRAAAAQVRVGRHHLRPQLGIGLHHHEALFQDRPYACRLHQAAPLRAACTQGCS